MNRLAEETSPYLLQHRDNPVDWYPWGEVAFERAHVEDRPLLLSVGYSACHWCHVMAHECFENHQLAALQNQLFVSVKVDREERPDVDKVYMDALQAMTGQGGWPMTVFLLPDGRPFFAGTYFPPEDRGGMPGFGRVLQAVSQAYQQQRAEVERTAAQLQQALIPVPAAASEEGTGWGELVSAAAGKLVQDSDRVHGGSRGAPKFPQCPPLELLLAAGALGLQPEALAVAREALRGMAQGGIRDQLAGGFHRYSVDDHWGVPHFEKMLYDNAQLALAYLHSWQAGGPPQDLAEARSTADFILEQLALPGGGFAASLDADTEEGEGAFYLWTEGQLQQVLDPEDLRLAQGLFNLSPSSLSPEGQWVLQGCPDPKALCRQEGLDREELSRRREQITAQLREARSRRPRPSRDDKLIVGWNALAISALAELGVALPDSPYLDRAVSAAEAVLAQARDQVGLHHLFDGVQPRFAASLEDLAGLGLAGLDLHEATGEASWFELGRELAQLAERDYRDPDGPGWFDTPLGHDPRLPVRPRAREDSPLPSGGSLMVRLCLRLAALTGDPAWEERGALALGWLAGPGERYPSAFGTALLGALQLAAGSTELALIAPSGRPGHLPLLRAARSRLRPGLVVGVGPPSQAGEGHLGPPLTWGRGLLQGEPAAYVCRDFICQRPVSSAEELELELGPGSDQVA